MWISRGGRSSKPSRLGFELVSARSGRNSFNHQAEKAKGRSIATRGFFEIVKTTRDSADNFSSFHCICVSAHGRGDGNLTDGDITLTLEIESGGRPAYYVDFKGGRSSSPHASDLSLSASRAAIRSTHQAEKAKGDASIATRGF